MLPPEKPPYGMCIAHVRDTRSGPGIGRAGAPMARVSGIAGIMRDGRLCQLRFAHDGHSYHASLIHVGATAWWWFEGSDETRRYAAMRALLTDTEDDVAARILSFYENAERRQARPRVRRVVARRVERRGRVRFDAGDDQ